MTEIQPCQPILSIPIGHCYIALYCVVVNLTLPISPRESFMSGGDVKLQRRSGVVSAQKATNQRSYTGARVGGTTTKRVSKASTTWKPNPCDVVLWDGTIHRGRHKA